MPDEYEYGIGDVVVAIGHMDIYVVSDHRSFGYDFYSRSSGKVYHVSKSLAEASFIKIDHIEWKP